MGKRVWTSLLANLLLLVVFSTDCFELGEGSGLHVPSGVWYELRALEPGVVILVLASGPHDPADYVHERSAMPLALAAAAEQTVALAVGQPGVERQAEDHSREPLGAREAAASPNAVSSEGSGE